MDKSYSESDLKDITLHVDGIDCAQCGESLCADLERSNNITTAQFNIVSSELELKIEPVEVDFPHLKKIIGIHGGQLADDKFWSSNFIAAKANSSEVNGHLTAKLLEQPEILSVSSNGSKDQVTVIHTNSREELTKFMTEFGFMVQNLTEKPTEIKQKARNWPLVLTVISGLFCAAGIGLGLLNSGQSEFSVGFYFFAIIFGGIFTGKKALAAIRVFKLDMNVLMCIAVLGAIGIGEWNEAAMVVFLFSLSNLLESYSVERARNAIKKLMNISPDMALLKQDNGTILKNIKDIKPGEIILIRAGERVPMDGEVMEGISHLDQSPITGESVPVEKNPGEKIFAGSINGTGVLEVRVTHSSNQSTLARIIKLVHKASSQKAPVEKFVDKFAKIYTPVVVLIAISIALIPPLFSGEWGIWFYRSLVMLVIACPCALVISTPVTLVSGLTRAARDGLLIKGGSFLEMAGKIKTVVFDKTGTLTKGNPELKNVKSLSGLSTDEILMIAAAIEKKSEHHLAKPIIERAKKRALHLPEAGSVISIPGKGITGEVDGKKYFIGNHRFFEEILLQIKLNGKFNTSGSAIYLWDEVQLLGELEIFDPVREESAEAVAALKKMGVAPIIMLTGDNKLAATRIAQNLQLDDFHAELLPDEKMRRLADIMKKTNSKTAMVGDGINDAPALAAADLGIAMGEGGTDIALETADIALMNDDLRKIPSLVQLSRRVMKIVRQNIAAAILIKLIFTLLIIPGIATLWLAVIADVGTSLLVILNGMRALKKTPAIFN